MTDRLKELSDLGVSIWLDDLDRSRLTSGGLATMIEHDHVVGVTTNPAIFGKAISTGAESYAAQVADLAALGADREQALNAMTTQDVRDACDVLASVAGRTAGRDGRVSIEVDPRLARDAEATIAQARALWSTVDRSNLLIKIPATVEGLPAITEVIASGISVNVTLIFSVDRYEQVLDAWAAGLERRLAQGLPLSGIHSVASFFVSRVDTAVDAALERIPGRAATDLRGKAGIANARLAWQAYRDFQRTARWQTLAAAGAAPQRPLWASTGVKDPAYPDDMYVVDLAGPGCVNTMPEATLRAVADHGRLHGNLLDGHGPASQQVFDDLTALGIDLGGVFARLEEEGVAKFTEAWEELLATVDAALAKNREQR